MPDHDDLPCGIALEVHGRPERLVHLYGDAPSQCFYEFDLADASQGPELLEAAR